MPRAEPQASDEEGEGGDRASALSLVAGSTRRSALRLREQGRRGAHWLKGVCTCRCSPAASGLTILGLLALIAGLIVAMHALAGPGSWLGPPPPPPPPCGTWPDYRPCSRCLHGANASLRHIVRAGETCETIAKQHAVPQFDLFIRNRSLGCCEAGDGGVQPTDRVDLCNAPTPAQWRSEGHPRKPPETGVVLSFLGMQPQARRGKSLPPPHHLSPSVNVAVLYSVIDTDSRGHFQINRKFTGNCSTFVDPTMAQRHDGAREDDRVWLASLDIDAGKWSGIAEEQWGQTAAASLFEIILRYRLDGIDVNIEYPRSSFGKYICSMFKHLREIDPGMITTLTPWGARWSSMCKPREGRKSPCC